MSKSTEFSPPAPFRVPLPAREGVQAPSHTDVGRRPADGGERCTCGKPAVVVFETELFGDVPWCGASDG